MNSISSIIMLAPASADDTPSRHPCKLVVSAESTEKRRYIFNPYRGKVTLDASSSASDDDVTDVLAAVAEENEAQEMIDESSIPQCGAHFQEEAGCFRISPGNIHHALVRFKLLEETFFVPPQERASLAVGDMVVVEGDRGQNVGVVTADLSSSTDESDPSCGRVIRRALNKDRKTFYQARRKEAFANKAAQRLVQVLGIGMQVLDTEYQTDFQKITIYYKPTVDGPVDFRQLQRALFKQFRCRIWLINWNADVKLQMQQQRQLSTRIGYSPAPQDGVMEYNYTPPVQEPHSTIHEPAFMKGVPTRSRRQSEPQQPIIRPTPLM